MDKQEQQLGFELGGGEPIPGEPNLREIREDLAALLNQARAATAQSPWDLGKLRYNKIVFLRLVELLPQDESDQLSFDFLAEVQRLELLLAA